MMRKIRYRPDQSDRDALAVAGLTAHIYKAPDGTWVWRDAVGIGGTGFETEYHAARNVLATRQAREIGHYWVEFVDSPLAPPVVAHWDGGRWHFCGSAFRSVSEVRVLSERLAEPSNASRRVARYRKARDETGESATLTYWTSFNTTVTVDVKDCGEAAKIVAASKVQQLLTMG